MRTPRRIRIAAIAALLLAAIPSGARANPALRAEAEILFRGTVGRYLLTETDQGLAILGRTTGVEIETAALGMWEERTGNVAYTYRRFLADMSRAETEADALRIAERIRQAEERVRGFRASNEAAGAPAHLNGGGGTGAIRSLSAAERALLDSFAGSMMRVEEGFRFVRELEAGSGALRGVGTTREAFLEGAEAGTPRMWHERAAAPSVEDPYAYFRQRFGRVPVGAEAAEWQTRGWLGEMKACLRSMPTRARRAATARLIGQQVVIAEVATVAGYVTASGGRRVDWGNLPTDMIVAGVAAAVEPFLALHGGSMFMRYVKMVGFGAAKGAFEAGYYYFTPLRDTHGHDPLEMSLARGGYSTGWSAASAAIKLGLFTAVLGLECMYPTASMAVISSGIQIAHRVGSTYGYFYVRNATFDSLGLGPNDAPPATTVDVETDIRN